MLSWSMGVKRSTTCNASLWKCPAISNTLLSLLLATSTTSVLPSQWPRESPIHAWYPSLGMLALHMDDTVGVHVFKHHGDVRSGLEKLERKVHGVRDAFVVAMPGGVDSM